jgi:hypothetical protein
MLRERNKMLRILVAETAFGIGNRASLEGNPDVWVSVRPGMTPS